MSNRANRTWSDRWADPISRQKMLASRDRPLTERLAKFQIKRGDDECWDWRGSNNGVGYPVLTINKKMRLATHVALEIDGRVKPSEKHVACHSCDNPICTNPAHLWWGTEKENMQDAAAKGRLSGWSRRKGAVRGTL